MMPLVEFRPGVFAREGESVRVGRRVYRFDGAQWVSMQTGHQTAGVDLPPELRTMPIVDTGTRRTSLGGRWGRGT